MATRVSDSQRRRLYGAPCNQNNLVLVQTPWGIKVRAHRLVAGRLHSALIFAADRSNWVPRRIDSFACRQIRGSTSTSLHAYGLAWDAFDLPLPQPVDVWGATNAPDVAFRQALADMGFSLGADFGGRKDYPHFEWSAAPPPLRTAALPAAPVEEQASIKPMTTQRYGEADGMNISSHFTQIPALDNDGRGWVDIPYPFERVLSITAQGNDPPGDGRYWPPLTLAASPRGAVTRVTLAGAPGKPCGFYWTLLEEP